MNETVELKFASRMKDRIKGHSFAEAKEILGELKLRGVMVAMAIEKELNLTEVQEVQLSTILGGVALIASSIEIALDFEGSGFGLKDSGLLAKATEIIAEIDDLLA